MQISNNEHQPYQPLIDWFTDDQWYQSNSISEQVVQQDAEEKALHLFHQVAIRVPAYKKFLRVHKVKPDLINTFADFQQLPILTKENYIHYYSMKERCWDGSTASLSSMSTSTGTTGAPQFWPQHLVQHIEGASAHEYVFSFFDTKKTPTLFINGFAMGNWIAGTFTLSCTQLLSWKGHQITVMSPGYVLDAVLETIETIGRQFKQIIIAGHTPFLKEVIEALLAKHIDISSLNIRLLGTGQAISENWRYYMTKQLKQESEYSSIINLYGSADAALMGFETPYSIYIRKLLFNDSEKNKQIFSDDRLPSLYQYDPRLTFFETIDHQLHLTKNSGAPLIRYNMQDRGGVISAHEMRQHFTSDTVKEIQLPFVYLFGRDQFMVKIYGANVYSEHVQQALTHEHLQPYLAGRYFLEVQYDDHNEAQILCHVELNRDIEGTAKIEELVREIFSQEVRKVNKEYNYVLEHMGDKAKPQVRLYRFGDPEKFPVGKMKKNA